MKKILIVSGSPRKHGNSDLLCDAFFDGAVEAGHDVEKIFLRDKKVGFCVACYYCQKHENQCSIKDDMSELLDKVEAADVIVLSSPVYFYAIAAQMKAFMDRFVSRWLKIKNKTFYYIMTSAEDGEHVMDCTLECFRGLARCLEGSTEGGVLFAKGVYEAGKVKDTTYIMDAHNMGKSIK